MQNVVLDESEFAEEAAEDAEAEHAEAVEDGLEVVALVEVLLMEQNTVAVAFEKFVSELPARRSFLRQKYH